MNNNDNNFSDSNYISFKIEKSFLIGTYKKNLEIDLEIAKQVVQQRLSFQNGNDYSSLADVRYIKSVSKEARDYFAKQDKGLIASAILGENPLSNMIINMFLTFSKPRIPAKAFQDKENALKWLNQFNVELLKKEPIPIYEFCKLDSIDLKVASWLFSKSPRALYTYLEFITKNNYKRKGIILNAQKVYDELTELRKANLN